MQKSTILAIALVCGSGAFLYTLYSGGSRERGARDAAFNAAASSRRAVNNLAVNPRPRDRQSLERAASENPTNPGLFFDPARFAEADGDAVAATKYWTATAKFASEEAAADSTRLRAPFMAAWAHERLGHAAQAKAAFRDLAAAHEDRLQNPGGGRIDPRTMLQRIGWCYQKCGDTASARNAWTRALKILQGRPADSLAPEELYDTGCLLALIGKKEEAFAALDAAARAGFPDGEWARADEDLESLRDDPRLKDIIARMRERRARRQAGE